MRLPILILAAAFAALFSPVSVSAEPRMATLSTEATAYAQLRPGGGRPGLRPRPPGMNRPSLNRPSLNRPGVGARPPGFNRPAVGGRPPVAVVRPDGSSVVIRPPGWRPRPPGVRPPIGRPPLWRPWRPGLRFAIAAGVTSASVAAQLGWCHVHRHPVPGMRFHQDVRCHRHVNWFHPSIAYVRAW